MKTELSVAIVAYHNYDDVQRAVESIENFTDSKISKKIYIIDNSDIFEDSPALKIFKNFLQEYSDVSYYSTRGNIGFGKGHNYIIHQLDSKYHAIVNPDIILREDAFAKILCFMESNTDVGMCIPRILDEKGELQPVYRREITVVDVFIRMFCKGMFPKRLAYHTLQNMDYSKPFQVPFGQGSFLVIRTQLFKELQGFDDKFFMYVEDADLSRRVNEVSKLVYFPGAGVVHKWEKGSHKNKRLFMYHVKSMLYYFTKWGFRLF